MDLALAIINGLMLLFGVIGYAHDELAHPTPEPMPISIPSDAIHGR